MIFFVYVYILVGILQGGRMCEYIAVMPQKSLAGLSERCMNGLQLYSGIYIVV